MKILRKLCWLILFGFILTTSCTAGTVYVRQAPPRAIVEVKLAKPYKAAIWVSGYWRWNQHKHKYVWVNGHWKKVKHGKTWKTGFWKQTPHGWIRVKGHWK